MRGKPLDLDAKIRAKSKRRHRARQLGKANLAIMGEMLKASVPAPSSIAPHSPKSTAKTKPTVSSPFGSRGPASVKGNYGKAL